MLKKLISKLNMKAGTFITMSALLFSVVAANTRCMCIYHQPEMPQKVKDLRK